MIQLIQGRRCTALHGRAVLADDLPRPLQVADSVPHLAHISPHGLRGGEQRVDALIHQIPALPPGILGLLQLLDVVQRVQAAGHHHHEHADALVVIRAHADGEIPLLPGKGHVDRHRLRADALQLRPGGIHAVAFLHVHRDDHRQDHVVSVVLPRQLVGLGGHVDLHQAGRPRQLLGPHFHAVQLVGDIEIPGELHLLRVHHSLVVKPLIFPVKVPGDGAVPRLRFPAVRHVDDLLIVAVVRVRADPVGEAPLHHAHVRPGPVIVQGHIHGLIHGDRRLRPQALRHRAERKNHRRQPCRRYSLLPNLSTSHCLFPPCLMPPQLLSPAAVFPACAPCASLNTAGSSPAHCSSKPGPPAPGEPA